MGARSIPSVCALRSVPRGAEGCLTHSRGLAFSCDLHLPESWPVARDGGCPSGEQSHGAVHRAQLLCPHHLVRPPRALRCHRPPGWPAALGRKFAPHPTPRAPCVHWARAASGASASEVGSAAGSPGVCVAFTVLDLLAAAETRAQTQAEHLVGLEMGVAVTQWLRGLLALPWLHPPRCRSVTESSRVSSVTVESHRRFVSPAGPCH
ncbi:hypothetical protein D623_10021618 [Myotis brandtii]|uniref:Uncharacterized protein n=1 Tax=Myotis brandtii TaxID=109478 RepID=S7NU18_MYOBR|nr:hypothetical protein D623_10021618 [Myotis brandtii]